MSLFSEVCSDVADVKPQEEEEEREDNSFSENGMQCAEGATDPRTHIHSPYIDTFPLRVAF